MADGQIFRYDSHQGASLDYLREKCLGAHVVTRGDWTPIVDMGVHGIRNDSLFDIERDMFHDLGRYLFKDSDQRIFDQHRLNAESGGRNLRSDDARNVTLQGELTKYIAGALAEVYSQTSARTIFPVAFTGAPWAQSIQWDKIHVWGQAQASTDAANVRTKAGVSVETMTTGTTTLDTEVEWTDEDELQDPQRKFKKIAESMKAARMVVMRKENQLAVTGMSDQVMGLRSAMNGVPTAAASTNWITQATGSTLYTSLVAATHAQVNDHDVLEFEPDTLALSTAAFNNIASVQMGTDNPQSTVMTWFLNNNRYVNSIVRMPELKTAGDSSTPIAFLFKRSSSILEYNVVRDFYVTDPWRKDHLLMAALTRVKTGGLVVKQPLGTRILTYP